MIDDAELSRRARRLAAANEPVVGQVYFSPECHREYEALGFGASPATAGGVALPDGPAYFTSRGSALGQVSGELVAAAFAVFNPAVVVPCVDIGWSLTDAATIAAARTRGAAGQLTRILGERPDGLERATELLQRAVAPLRVEGRPLYAGTLARGWPGEPDGRSVPRRRPVAGVPGRLPHRGMDHRRLRRHRDRVAVRAVPGHPVAHLRAQPRLERGRSSTTPLERLADRGLVIDGAFTDTGRAARERVEQATDAQMRPAIEAIGDDFDELIAILRPWGDAIRAAGGYLTSAAQLMGS